MGLPAQTVGIKHVDERLWLATFMHCDLSYFDDETRRLESIQPGRSPDRRVQSLDVYDRNGNVTELKSRKGAT